MIFESEGFYVDLVENKDLIDIVEVYNSNKYFLVNHLDTDAIKYEWILEELKPMKRAGFYSCKVVEKSSEKIIGIIDFKTDEETYLTLLMVHNDYKNKGFWELIYKALEEYAKSMKSKCVRIDLVTGYDETVVNFWGKNGFTKFKDVELN